jgi:hypothetical protein
VIFTVDDAVLADFTAFLESKNIDVTGAELQANIDGWESNLNLATK